MPDLILSANGDAPAAPPAPQPNYHVTPDGLIITIPSGPNTALQHAVPAPILREIVKKWREVERVNEGMARIAADALRTKQ